MFLININQNQAILVIVIIHLSSNMNRIYLFWSINLIGHLVLAAGNKKVLCYLITLFSELLGWKI
jgi:hypothetical protein